MKRLVLIISVITSTIMLAVYFNCKQIDEIIIQSNTTENPSKKEVASDSTITNNTTSNNPSTTPENNSTENLFNNLSNILNTDFIRESKIQMILKTLKSAKTDEEKQLAITSLFSLYPIEEADYFISMLNDNTLNAAVKANVMQLLNECYFMPEEIVRRVGVTNITNYQDKFSALSKELIYDKNLEQNIRDEFFFSYSYTNPDDSGYMLQTLANKELPITDSVINYLVTNSLTSVDGMDMFFPSFAKSGIEPEKSALTLAILSTSPGMFETLRPKDRMDILNFIQTHPPHPDSEDYEINNAMITTAIEKLTVGEAPYKQ